MVDRVQRSTGHLFHEDPGDHISGVGVSETLAGRNCGVPCVRVIDQLDRTHRGGPGPGAAGARKASSLMRAESTWLEATRPPGVRRRHTTTRGNSTGRRSRRRVTGRRRPRHHAPDLASYIRAPWSGQNFDSSGLDELPAGRRERPSRPATGCGTKATAWDWAPTPSTEFMLARRGTGVPTGC